jgi:Tfp pilus assembly protein PilV
MRKFRVKRNRRNSEAGLTMLEVLFGAVVMTIGFLGLIGLVTAAIASNNRNKLDSTATMLTQAVVEQINSTIVGTGTATITDCNGTAYNIASAVGGAATTGANIDWSQTTVPTSYSMNFAVCPVAQANYYDVRWNVQQVTSDVYLITVGARFRGQGAGGNKYFALPVNLRTYASPQ